MLYPLAWLLLAVIAANFAVHLKVILGGTLAAIWKVLVAVSAILTFICLSFLLAAVDHVTAAQYTSETSPSAHSQIYEKPSDKLTL